MSYAHVWIEDIILQFKTDEDMQCKIKDDVDLKGLNIMASNVVDDRTNLVTVTVRPNLEVRWFGRTSRYGRPNHHRTKSLHLSSFLRIFGVFLRIFF